ncbi:30S ribosomal protein S20 [Thiohalospira sp.]|uniref:30S ribosomal protein S20 n=1 Tax=Thiohalospira sp. TaxID=3080549 RepID=UPI00397EEF43
MANTRQTRKRARQNEKQRLHNAALRSRMRTFIKSVERAIRAGDKETAQQAYQAAVPIIDKTANKGIIHRNKAARHKSRLNERLRAM